MIRSVTVVGGSLAGVSAVRALRAQGFDGRVKVVGAEPHAPYDRPPLSKGFLTAPDEPSPEALLQDDEDLEDLPDPIVNGRIDLGGLVAETLVLGLDPYPRKPGVAFADPTPAAPEPPEASPFAVLRGLKPGDEG